MLKKGYLLFPKVLFEEQIKVTKGATGYFDAFILVLTHVNYSTVECRIHQYTFQCRRGESVMSMVHWAELFGWKRSRTRYFFNKMYDEGIIERLSNPYITHIRIPDYDLLVGQKRRKSVRAEADGITFDAFWENIMILPGSLKPMSAVLVGNGTSYLSTNVVSVLVTSMNIMIIWRISSTVCRLPPICQIRHL